MKSVWKRVSIYDGAERFLQDFGAIDKWRGDLYSVFCCESEVCNGGFDQFFGNSTGVLAPEAMNGFVQIGLSDVADVIRNALSYFGPTYPRDRDARISRMRPKKESSEVVRLFAHLDDEFYALIQTDGGRYHDRLRKAMDEYALKNLNTN